MTQVDRLTVDLGLRSYPILIGSGLLANAELWSEYLDAPQVLVVTDQHVAPLYWPTLQTRLTSKQVEHLVLPAGEEHKNLTSLENILNTLARNNFSRDCALIALGGGVIGDLTGFAAACYHRGVTFIQAPTSLLAQVDASIGGKTGINHAAGKNLIGAFYQPRLVLIDIATLATLPEREYVAGLAEIIKYGLVADGEFFAWLEQHIDELKNRNIIILQETVRRCCTLKAAIVADDECEGGDRALLNLGHTFGHAIEQATGFKEWLHGEAVAVGLVQAAQYSRQLGLLDDDATKRINRLIERAGLPSRPPRIGAERALDIMHRDKKVRDGDLRLVLLQGIGSARLIPQTDARLIKFLRVTFGHDQTTSA